eukprot:537452_1
MASLSMSLHCILFTFLVSMSLAFKELLKYEGMDCGGSGEDILRDFEGNEDQCKAKCQELGNECVGFTRVKSGSSAYVGKCYFRGGSLETPTTNSERDCFESYPGLFARNAGMTCTGTDDDILRDYTGTADECKAMCSSLEECAGFVRVNSGSGHAGKCFFRGGHLSDPSSYSADDRDCYVPTAFQKYTASNCAGSSTDILRDYEGSALACKEKCLTLDGCVGFVRVNSGTYGGKCYFRGGSLNPPEPYSNDDRDCYVPASLMDFNEYEDSQCTGSSGDHTDDILRDFAGTVDECKDDSDSNEGVCVVDGKEYENGEVIRDTNKCVSLDGCVGFVEVNGLCYFRGGALSAPSDWDGRSCFEPYVVTSPEAKTCVVDDKEYANGEVIRDTRHECIGYHTDTAFAIFQEVCRDGNVKEESYDGECETGVCCKSGDFVACTTPDCEVPKGRSCFFAGIEYEDGETIDVMGYTCPGWGAMQSQRMKTVIRLISWVIHVLDGVQRNRE